MPRQIGKLTDKAIKALTGKRRLSDGGSLWVQCDERGNKSFLFQYEKQIDGRRKTTQLGLGGYGYVTSLAEAREIAARYRRLLRDGLDPRHERHSERAKIAQARNSTFKVMAEQFLAANTAAWKSERHRQQWISSLERFAFPTFGDLPCNAITTGHVVGVLTPLWATKTETASRLRLRVERVLSFAKAHGHLQGDNVAAWRGHLDRILPPPGKLATPRHMPALPYHDVPELMEKLAAIDSPAAAALRFLILTASRTGEVIGCRWSEIDIETKIWTLPPSRMKAGREHRVPLSDLALDLLKGLERTGEFVFTFNGTKPMAADSLRKELRATGEAHAVTHGFRSSFRDWCRERHVPSEVAEAALAHVIEDKTERAYARSDLLDARRMLMTEWAVFCGSGEGNEAMVLPLSKGRRHG